VRTTLKVLAVFLLLVVLVVGLELWSSRGEVAPESVQTLKAYLDWRADANEFIQLDGPQPHLAAIGPLVGLVPSGPSVYVFDANGQLVDATRDIGDDPDFANRRRVRLSLPREDRRFAEDW
jgi:hypothetical protein